MNSLPAEHGLVYSTSLVKVYGQGGDEIRALGGVSLDFQAQRFTAIMGPSGSGKSTLMHCLAGLDRPTSGRVVVAGHEITSLGEKELTVLRRTTIGFVFQAFNLVPTLTAAENIDLPPAIAGKPIDRAWRDTIVEVLGLRDRLDHRPSQLSGGQQQRVACARALIAKPAVVFADEPTGNLDTAAAAEVLTFLRRSVEEFGQSIIMVTHDPVAAAYAHRIVFLADGQLAGQLKNPTVAGVIEALKIVSSHPATLATAEAGRIGPAAPTTAPPATAPARQRDPGPVSRPAREALGTTERPGPGTTSRRPRAQAGPRPSATAPRPSTQATSAVPPSAPPGPHHAGGRSGAVAAPPAQTTPAARPPAGRPPEKVGRRAPLASPAATTPGPDGRTPRPESAATRGPVDSGAPSRQSAATRGPAGRAPATAQVPVGRGVAAGSQPAISPGPTVGRSVGPRAGAADHHPGPPAPGPTVGRSVGPRTGAADHHPGPPATGPTVGRSVGPRAGAADHHPGPPATGPTVRRAVEPPAGAADHRRGLPGASTVRVGGASPVGRRIAGVPLAPAPAEGRRAPARAVPPQVSPPAPGDPVARPAARRSMAAPPPTPRRGVRPEDA